MKDWFNDLLIVLTYSKRTQLAIVLGIVGYFLILVWGHYQLSDFELSGSMSSFSELIKQKLLQRYDKVALGCLVSFWGTAIVFYKKDRKRLFS